MPGRSDPRRTWADGVAYDRQAEALREMFEQNTDRMGAAANLRPAEVSVA